MIFKIRTLRFIYLKVRNLIYQFKGYKFISMIYFNKTRSLTPILRGTGFDYNPIKIKCLMNYKPQVG
jgi:hypothetical protein